MLFTLKLNDNKDFLRLYKKGRYVAGSSCVIYYFRNRLPYNRMGITAGKKLGGAVQRNRAKRLIRQAYRETETLFPVGFDLVIVARAAILNEKCPSVTAFLRSCAKRINKQEKSDNKSNRNI